MTSNDWFTIRNIHEIDSPAMAIYPERVRENLRVLKSFVPETARLRPHIKTHKTPEVARLMIDEGIHKFKCATIAEAEMLAAQGARDILLAYQPVGPKARRFAELIKKFPGTAFSCLIDNLGSAQNLSAACEAVQVQASAFLDLNIGMNRTGILPSKEALSVYLEAGKQKGLHMKGLHAYDGHLRDTDFEKRTQRCNEGFTPVESLRKEIIRITGQEPAVIAGGSPTFPIHAKRTNVECSPGTFIFWDMGYHSILKEQPFVFAALVIARVVSKPNENIICVDLGHKAIASENPLPNRVHFLNTTGLEPIGHSEEHMVFKTHAGSSFNVGDVLYGVPYHVCPTVALYDSAYIVRDNEAKETWAVTARGRKLTV